MPYDSNKHLRRSIRLPGYDYRQPGHYFVTVCPHQHHLLQTHRRHRHFSHLRVESKFPSNYEHHPTQDVSIILTRRSDDDCRGVTNALLLSPTRNTRSGRDNCVCLRTMLQLPRTTKRDRPQQSPRLPLTCPGDRQGGNGFRINSVGLCGTRTTKSSLLNRCDLSLMPLRAL